MRASPRASSRTWIPSSALPFPWGWRRPRWWPKSPPSGRSPPGLTVIPGRELHRFLADVPVEKVWGIGRQTTALLAKHGVRTALEFARRPEEWVTKRFTKPVVAIWQELNGTPVLPVETQPKETYASIQKVKTFTPASADRELVYAQLAKNIENACIKARRYKLAAQRVLHFPADPGLPGPRPRGRAVAADLFPE